MAIAPVLSIIIVHVGAGYALHGLSHALLALTDEQVEVVRHEAVGVIGAVASAGVAFVIVAHSHPVKGCDELEVVFLVLKDILVVDASHHHVEYPRARFCAWLSGHLFVSLPLYMILSLYYHLCEMLHHLI